MITYLQVNASDMPRDRQVITISTDSNEPTPCMENTPACYHIYMVGVKFRTTKTVSFQTFLIEPKVETAQKVK